MRELSLKQLACLECDLLLRMPDETSAHQKIQCPRCHHSITKGHRNPLDSSIALSFTAIVILLIAVSFPFISFAAQGQSRTISLFQTVGELFAQGFYTLAILVLLFIILLPFLYLLLLLAILIPIKLGFKRSPPVLTGKIMGKILPWSMAEVFLIGVLVALIKIVAMADIILGLSFWAYIVFAPLFTYIESMVDHHRLWHWIEHGH